MLSELYLKFHSETGSKPMSEICDDEGEFIDIPSDEYLEWLEDLAMKYLKLQQK